MNAMKVKTMKARRIVVSHILLMPLFIIIILLLLISSWTIEQFQIRKEVAGQ